MAIEASEGPPGIGGVPCTRRGAGVAGWVGENGASSTESLEAPVVEDGQAVDLLLLSILSVVNAYDDTFDAVLTGR